MRYKTSENPQQDATARPHSTIVSNRLVVTLFDVAEPPVAPGFSVRQQRALVADLGEAFLKQAEDAPNDVKRQMLMRLHDHVMDADEPSAGLQYNLTAPLAHSLHFLTDPTCTFEKESQNTIKSTLLMATAPGATDATS